MKISAPALRRADHAQTGYAFLAGLFFLLVNCTFAQDAQKPSVSVTRIGQAAGLLPDGARFVDVTSASNINFEYVASHTSRKYLLETMGSGVALFDYDNDGRLDIYAVNAAPLSDPTPKGTIPQK